MFQSVLICTNFADGIQRLMGFIPELAASGIEKIVFLHCVPLWQDGEIPREDTEAIAAAQERFRQVIHPEIPGMEVVWEVQSGPPDENIMAMAERHQIQALILGSTTRSFLTEKLFGSTTANLAYRLDRPLLTLRPQLVSTYTRDELALRCRHLLQYLLVLFDGSPTAYKLIDRLKAQVQRHPNSCLKQCRLLWLVDQGNRRLPQPFSLEEMEEKLAVVQQDLQSLGLKVATEIRQGDSLPELMEVAMTHDISAIAVSSSRANALLDWSVPSFSNEIMRQSWYPVLFFPAGRSGAKGSEAAPPDAGVNPEPAPSPEPAASTDEPGEPADLGGDL